MRLRELFVEAMRVARQATSPPSLLPQSSSFLESMPLAA
jgi:hypothetical protein